jgi:Zn-finger nucleic acid-binding protein
MSSSPLPCPRCRATGIAHPLVQHPVGGVVLFGCNHCGGVFLQQRCAMFLATHLPDDVLHTTARSASAAKAAPDRAAALHCPMCGNAMKRSHVAASQIEIDSCGCGTFYDKDEIAALAEGIRRTRWSSAVAAGAAVGVGAVGAVAVGGAALGVASMDDEQRNEVAEVATEVASLGVDVGAEVVAEVGVETAAEVGGSLLGGVFELLGGLFEGL